MDNSQHQQCYDLENFSKKFAPTKNGGPVATPPGARRETDCD